MYNQICQRVEINAEYVLPKLLSLFRICKVSRLGVAFLIYRRAVIQIPMHLCENIEAALLCYPKLSLLFFSIHYFRVLLRAQDVCD